MDTFKRVLETGHVPGHAAGDWTCFGHVHSDTFNVSENVSDSLVGNCTAIKFQFCTCKSNIIEFMNFIFFQVTKLKVFLTFWSTDLGQTLRSPLVIISTI